MAKEPTTLSTATAPTTERVADNIVLIRGVQVILDSDIAEMYGVESRVLNQAVKRNAERFPEHFCFQLTTEEWACLRSRALTSNPTASLRSQSVTLEKTGRGQHRKYLPYAKRKTRVHATIYTKKLTKALQLDLEKHNTQYPPISAQVLTGFHDRFLLVDNKELYHLGASLKDLGKQCFAFSRMDDFAPELSAKLPLPPS